jgi:hypothetical protein
MHHHQGLTATGGVISDYIDGSDVYRAHIFTSSGTFDVSAIGDYPLMLSILLLLVVEEEGWWCWWCSI